jgi:hypothetical protein
MNHKSWIEERQIMQWPNERQATNRIKTDNTMAKWTTSHAVHLAIALSVFLLLIICGSFAYCIICLSSVHGLWFIWPLYYLSFFYSWIVVHLAIVFSLFLLFMTCGSFGHCIISKEQQIMQWPNEPQVMNIRKTDNTMVKWTISHAQKKDR